MRRTPSQARSKARVDAILDAADAVFLELGYAYATTNHVAARAGTSIGSLYRFFPDKESLLRALANRYAERMRVLAEETSRLEQVEGGADQAGLTLAQLVGRGIDTFGAFLKASPGFMTIMQESRNPVLRQGTIEHGDQVAQIIGATQQQLAPHLSPELQRTVSVLTQVVLGTIHELALSGDEAHRLRVLEEGKRLVTLYLASRLDIDPAEPLEAVLKRAAAQAPSAL